MNVLSLFDGMSCGQIALNKAGVKYNNYYASEIDKSAIKIAKHNYPKTIQIGDVKEVSTNFLPQIDLLIGGSPCQGFSFAGRQLNFEDPRSKLFFEFVRLLNEIKEYNPNVLFLLENVDMKNEYQNIISEILGVKPIIINSNLVSAQNRKRLYWTNITGVTTPEDKGVLILDIIDENNNQKVFNIEKYNPVMTKNYVQFDVSGKGYKSQQDRAFYENGKFGCFPNARATTKRKIITGLGINNYRNLTLTECERLQTVPDNYTNVEGVSEGQALCALGNGWTVDVIVHIFKNIR